MACISEVQLTAY